jgi:hypothetical protein
LLPGHEPIAGLQDLDRDLRPPTLLTAQTGRPEGDGVTCENQQDQSDELGLAPEASTGIRCHGLIHEVLD